MEEFVKLKNENDETLKAGCILINKLNGCVALIYREGHDDYSFPKGHLEMNETLVECAIRETAEETKRVAVLAQGIEPYIERYTTPKGEKCVCYMYICFDDGPSDNTSTDTHDLHWIPFLDVEKTLSYQSLKTMWNSVKSTIQKLLNI